jgi:hypothetical protein
MPKNNINKTPIISYDFQNGEIKRYEWQCFVTNDGYNTTKVGGACRLSELSHKGKFWFYEVDFNIENLKKRFIWQKTPHNKKKFKEIKECTKCKVEKHFTQFYKAKEGISGTASTCKECNKKKAELFRRQRGVPIKIKLAKSTIKKSTKKYKYSDYKEQKRNYQNKRYNNDIEFKIRCTLRNRLTKAIKRDYKNGSAVRDLGCSIPELKLYLESLFQPGMTWDNWSVKGWHIDHVIPLVSFNLSDREQLIKAVHYTNLQPMWAFDNLSKADKIMRDR